MEIAAAATGAFVCQGQTENISWNGGSAQLRAAWYAVRELRESCNWVLKTSPTTNDAIVTRLIEEGSAALVMLRKLQWTSVVLPSPRVTPPCTCGHMATDVNEICANHTKMDLCHCFSCNPPGAEYDEDAGRRTSYTRSIVHSRCTTCGTFTIRGARHCNACVEEDGSGKHELHCEKCLTLGCDECPVPMYYCNRHNAAKLRVCDDCQDIALCAEHRFTSADGRMLCRDCREDSEDSVVFNDSSSDADEKEASAEVLPLEHSRAPAESPKFAKMYNWRTSFISRDAAKRKRDEKNARRREANKKKRDAAAAAAAADEPISAAPSQQPVKSAKAGLAPGAAKKPRK